MIGHNRLKENAAKLLQASSSEPASNGNNINSFLNKNIPNKNNFHKCNTNFHINLSTLVSNIVL